MWGLALTNMFPSTQKDRANVLEPRPDTPSTPLCEIPFHLHLRLSLSHRLFHCFVFFISQPFYLSPPLSATLISGPFFPSSLLGFLRRCFPVLQSFFPHLRVIPWSWGMYSFICMAPAFYWIPIALEQRYHISNSSRANLIQNSWSGHPSGRWLQCTLCGLRVPPVCIRDHQ